MNLPDLDENEQESDSDDSADISDDSEQTSESAPLAAAQIMGRSANDPVIINK